MSDLATTGFAITGSANIGSPRTGAGRALARGALRFSLCGALFFLGCQTSTPPASSSVESAVVEAPASNNPAGAANSPPAADSLSARSALALSRGARWLLAQQAEDGGWRSQTYGAWKGGAATTALAMYAGGRLPADLRQERLAAWRRGWTFLEPATRAQGFVVCPDGTMDEPVYATALLLLASEPLALDLEPELIARLEDFLLRERCADQRGFPPDDPNYGGWDLAGGTGLRAQTPGSNISITRFSAQALGQRLIDAELRKEIAIWTMRLQNFPVDGGFFFHPQRDHEGNKAQWVDGEAREHPRSYGTATCDGVLLLALCVGPLTPGDEHTFGWREFQAGRQWLVERADVDRVPGFEDAPPELGWQQGLLFYYWMSLAETLRYLPEKTRRERSAAIVEQLLATQHPDGRWENSSNRMREDDPIVATSFALVALSVLTE